MTAKNVFLATLQVYLEDESTIFVVFADHFKMEQMEKKSKRYLKPLLTS